MERYTGPVLFLVHSPPQLGTPHSREQIYSQHAKEVRRSLAVAATKNVPVFYFPEMGKKKTLY